MLLLQNVPGFCAVLGQRHLVSPSLQPTLQNLAEHDVIFGNEDPFARFSRFRVLYRERGGRVSQIHQCAQSVSTALRPCMSMSPDAARQASLRDAKAHA